MKTLNLGLKFCLIAESSRHARMRREASRDEERMALTRKGEEGGWERDGRGLEQGKVGYDEVRKGATL